VSKKTKLEPASTQVVAINACFGGFGLSPAALRRCYELGAAGLEQFEPKKYFIGDWQTQLAAMKAGKGYSSAIVIETPRGDRVVSWNDDNRTDPVLIAVIRELGAAANGECAELKLVEIPAGVKYTVEYYDGVEHIAEEHQTWS
jgi:hypothetical protein